MRRTILIKTVPMDTRRLVAQLIPNGDNQTFAFGNIQGGNGPLPVDAHYRPVEAAIRIAVNPRDVIL